MNRSGRDGKDALKANAKVAQRRKWNTSAFGKRIALVNVAASMSNIDDTEDRVNNANGKNRDLIETDGVFENIAVLPKTEVDRCSTEVAKIIVLLLRGMDHFLPMMNDGRVGGGDVVSHVRAEEGWRVQLEVLLGCYREAHEV